MKGIYIIGVLLHLYLLMLMSAPTKTARACLPWAWATVIASILFFNNRLSKSLRKGELEEVEEASSPQREPFPWEPKTTTTIAQQTSSRSSSPPLGYCHTAVIKSTEEQLQFLACMTFASGLRSPSCPCCT